LGRRGRAGRSPDLHESALAPAGGVHCPRAHQPRRSALDHAPPHPGGNGRAGARGRLRKTLSGDRPVGDLHRLGGPARGRIMARAAVTSVLLSVLFLIVYSSTNWFTSRRSDVGTWYFQWEVELIPFVLL